MTSTKRAKPEAARPAAGGGRQGCGSERVCRRKCAWGPKAAGGVARPATLLIVLFIYFFKIEEEKYESRHLKHLPGKGWYACCITVYYSAAAPWYTWQCQVCLQTVCASSPAGSCGVIPPGVNTAKGKSVFFFLCDLGALLPACSRPGGKLADSKLL